VRFFIFFYVFQTRLKQGNGFVCITTEGCFPNNNSDVKPAVINQIPFEVTASDVCVTSWKEMSESDYRDFVAPK
jgi:hypothetical protein